MPSSAHTDELLAARQFFLERTNAAYLWEAGSPELLYCYRILRRLCDDPATRRFDYYVTNNEALPRVGRDVVVVQVGNEDHAVPAYVDDVLAVFTPYPPHRGAPANLLPIPLGCNGNVPELPVSPFADRPLDAFFSGQDRNDRWKIARGVERAAAMHGVRGLNYRVEYTEGFAAGMRPDEYARCLMDARIAFAPRGTLSPVTFRFFEAARAGNAIISCILPDTWYYRPFPGIQIDDWDSLPVVLADLLADPSTLAAMHRRTLSYYRRFCSESAVAAYMKRAILDAAGVAQAAALTPHVALEGIA